MPRKPSSRSGVVPPRGGIAAQPQRCVFINCPFDAEFAALFDAIVFATVCCGFVPRSAIESGNVAEPRIERIMRALFSSKYSIHDLSRCTGEGEERLARFNMPLELGMAMACRQLARNRRHRHDWLVLVPAGHRYLRFVSDLGAFDPATHESSVESVIPKVMAWLASRPDAIQMPSPQQVLAQLPRFQERRHQLGVDWSGDVPWRLVLEVAAETIPRF